MLIEGQPQYIQGSGRLPYELKNTGGILSCSCPAWRNQSEPIENRSCKHLKALLGLEAEAARCGRKLRTDEKTKLAGPPVMLAHSYDGVSDVTGWWWSEKLDGVRAYWNGTDFISRQGNIFHAPKWFKEGLPNLVLDGELWMGRKMFQQTIGVVKRLDGGDMWKQIQYKIYDMPGHESTFFGSRLFDADVSLGMPSHREKHVTVLEHQPLRDTAHLFDLLEEYEKLGAEGLMIRNPVCPYVAGRSHDLLKVKHFSDAEATVLGYEPGKGRHKGRLGALTVMLPDGKQFSLGTGLTDKERENPPPVGAKVTYRFTELTNGGIPKCASFLRVRVPE